RPTSKSTSKPSTLLKADERRVRGGPVSDPRAPQFAAAKLRAPPRAASSLRRQSHHRSALHHAQRTHGFRAFARDRSTDARLLSALLAIEEGPLLGNKRCIRCPLMHSLDEGRGFRMPARVHGYPHMH